MDGFLREFTQDGPAYAKMRPPVVDTAALLRAGDAGAALQAAAMGQSMGSTVIPPMGPSSDAAMRAGAVSGFDPGAYVRQSEQESAQNVNGAAHYQLYVWRHRRPWGDQKAYPMPQQNEAFFAVVAPQPDDGDPYLLPFDGGFSGAAGDGIQTKSVGGPIIGWTALNAELAWHYVTRLRKARRDPIEYFRFKEMDRYEELPRIWNDYRFFGVVFATAAKDGPYAVLAQDRTDGWLPNVHLVTAQMRGGRVKMVDYSDGAGMINGAALYLVLRYVPIHKNTLYSFVMQAEDERDASSGQFPVEIGWFTEDGVDEYYVPQFCMEARPQHGDLPSEFLESRVVYPPPFRVAGGADEAPEVITNRMGMAMRIGTLEDRSVTDAKGSWRYRRANESADAMFAPTDIYTLANGRNPVEILIDMKLCC